MLIFGAQKTYQTVELPCQRHTFEGKVEENSVEEITTLSQLPQPAPVTRQILKRFFFFKYSMIRPSSTF